MDHDPYLGTGTRCFCDKCYPVPWVQIGTHGTGTAPTFRVVNPLHLIDWRTLAFSQQPPAHTSVDTLEVDEIHPPEEEANRSAAALAEALHMQDDNAEGAYGMEITFSTWEMIKIWALLLLFSAPFGFAIAWAVIRVVEKFYG